MANSKHDQVANKIAKQEGTEYNKGQGADVQSKRRAIEIETPQTIGDAARQLQGLNKGYGVVTLPDQQKADFYNKISKAQQNKRGLGNES